MTNVTNPISISEETLSCSLSGVGALQQAMDKNPLVFAPDASLREVMVNMNAGSAACAVGTQEQETPPPRRVNYVLIMVEQDLLGIFTERDVVRLSAQDIDFSNVKIAEVMTRSLITQPASELRDAFTVLTLFRQHRIRHLPILNDSGQVLGVITTDGLRKSLQPNTLLKMRTVSEVMSLRPITASATTSVMDIAQLMATHQISCVVIVHPDGPDSAIVLRPIGIITERDIVQFQTLELNFRALLAESVMSCPLECMTLTDTLWQAQQTMQQLHVRRLVVIDAQGALQGILTQSSMLAVLNGSDLCSTLEVLQQQVDQLQNEKVQLLQTLNAKLENQVEADAVEILTYRNSFQATFEQAAVGMAQVDLQGQFRAANQRFCEWLGYAPAELLQKSFLDVTLTDDQALDHQQIQRLIQGDLSSFSREKQYCRQDGSRFWGNVTVSLVTSPTGAPDYLIAVVENISDRKRAEEALQQLNQELEDRVRLSTAAYRDSEARYRSLYENTPVMLHSIDRDGRLISVSNTWLAQMGYERSEVIGQFSTDFLTPASQDYARTEVLPHYFQMGICEDVSYQFVTKQGEVIDVLLSAIAERNPDGDILRTLAVSVDVTERNRIEAALCESEERFRLAFEKAAIGMALISPVGQWLQVNTALCDIVGYSEAEMLALTFHQITHPEDLATDVHSAEQLLAGEIDTYHTEKRYIHKQGHEIWIALSASLVRQEDGSPLYFITQIQDMSVRKLNEQKLSESLAEKNVMLQEIHHRVKNNLQVICSLLNLQTQTSDLQIAEIMQESQNRVQSMALVHENLYQSKNLSKISLESYVKELTNNLLRSYRSRVSLTQINVAIPNIHLDIDTAVPCGLIINELVSNALKYAFPHHQTGVITINILEHSDQTLTLTIADNGIGLPAKMKIGQTRTLGLQMVKTLTRQISGTIAVNREAGTSFQIQFPHLSR